VGEIESPTDLLGHPCALGAGRSVVAGVGAGVRTSPRPGVLSRPRPTPRRPAPSWPWVACGVWCVACGAWCVLCVVCGVNGAPFTGRAVSRRRRQRAAVGAPRGPVPAWMPATGWKAGRSATGIGRRVAPAPPHRTAVRRLIGRMLGALPRLPVPAWMRRVLNDASASNAPARA
jgi:hypothetical protein